ncbi:MAG: hypothetical protein A2202_03785 [Bdellovibrionales bacterium RIFOXYA1_FULL_36_14]|nr:MAG: hypothetical protein A2202_03785 [Bdellovibrionales bacterium RIFOXYA1_FULL_36_14]
MSSRIKIDGTYNQYTITMLEEMKINDFSFDLRPKSFNFVQEYVLLDILKEIYRPWNRYYLHFENEKEYVIEKILNDVKASAIKTDNTTDLIENILLEFSDGLPVQYYESFKTPYIFHLDERHRLEDFLACKYLKAVNLSYAYLHHLHQGGKLGEFAGSFLKLLKRLEQHQKIEVMLLRDWDEDIFPSLLHYFQFHVTSFPLNHKVELSYRNLNYELLKKYIKGMI